MQASAVRYITANLTADLIIAISHRLESAFARRTNNCFGNLLPERGNGSPAAEMRSGIEEEKSDGQ